jgi:hypothetical protein
MARQSRAPSTRNIAGAWAFYSRRSRFERFSAASMIGLVIFAAVALVFRVVNAEAQTPPPTPPNVNGNCNNLGNNNFNCNTLNIGPVQRRLSLADVSKISTALNASASKGSVDILTDLSNCQDCDSFATQLAQIIGSASGWTAKSVRNIMSAVTISQTRGVALGVKNTDVIPPSARSLVAAFAAAGGNLSIINWEPPNGSDSVLIVFPPMM